MIKRLIRWLQGYRKIDCETLQREYEGKQFIWHPHKSQVRIIDGWTSYYNTHINEWCPCRLDFVIGYKNQYVYIKELPKSKWI